MRKYGLEKEFFLVKKNTKEIVIPEEAVKEHLPLDGCGYLVEARGEAYPSIFDAIFSLMGKIEEIKYKLKDTEYELCDDPVRKVSKEMLIKVLRNHAKSTIKFNNYTGFTSNREKGSEKTAGVHLSITEEITQTIIVEKTIKEIKYYKNFDWMQIFLKLDKEFKQEIKEAKRNPGFYEIKNDGRIEYRSLPSNVNLIKLAEVIKEIK